MGSVGIVVATRTVEKTSPSCTGLTGIVTGLARSVEDVLVLILGKTRFSTGAVFSTQKQCEISAGSAVICVDRTRQTLCCVALFTLDIGRVFEEVLVNVVKCQTVSTTGAVWV